MQSRKPLTRAFGLLASMTLLTGLSACAPSIRTTQDALPCWKLLKASGLLNPTPGAARPQSDEVGEIGSFGDRQTGQLDKSNADKTGATNLGDVCEAEQKKALEDAKKRNRRKVLGVF